MPVSLKIISPCIQPKNSAEIPKTNQKFIATKPSKGFITLTVTDKITFCILFKTFPSFTFVFYVPDTSLYLIEPSHVKNNNLVSDQV